MSSRWMDVHFVDCSAVFLDSGDVAKSWSFLESCLFLCYDLGPESSADYLFPSIIAYPDHPVSPSLANIIQTPSGSADCASLYISRPVSYPSFHTVDILSAPFDSYCMYHSTLDPLPIRLVVDRPWWTSSVYIRRPLLR